MESISRLTILPGSFGGRTIDVWESSDCRGAHKKPTVTLAPSWFKDSTRRIEFRILEGHFLPLGCLLWSGLSQPTGVECV